MTIRLSARFALLLLPLLLVSSAPQAERPHILLISVDTLRADHLGAYGYTGNKSPFLDSLAARGVLFENVYVPLPQTGPSHASLLTSVSPPQHRVLTNGLPLSPDVDTLAAAMKRAGYHTVGEVAVSHIGRAAGYARGFDDFTQTEKDEIMRDADRINADARSFIDRYVAAPRGHPLFMFLHYFDCHYPYRWWDRAEKAPDPWNLEVQQRRDMQLRRYDDGVARVDAHIREIYEYARRKLGPNILIVVTADHGEQIGDHGVAVGHADIYRETTAVPLIIAGPRIKQGRVAMPVSSLDIGVALAGVAGAKFANRVDGHDLLEAAARSTSLLGRFSAGEKPRPFIVTGSPGYTRSVALIEGSSWFIKNFDHFYRNAWVEMPASHETGAGTPIVPTAAASGETIYTVPFTRYRPFFVAIEHVAKDADCAMTAVAAIAPGIHYYADPIAFKGSIRMTLPAARLDRITLTVAPARCAGRTTYQVLRVEDVRAPASAYRLPTLFAQLCGLRKGNSKDELFDVHADPRMVNNLVETTDPTPISEKLRSLYKAVANLPPPTEKISPEERRRLRSLGYLN